MKRKIKRVVINIATIIIILAVIGILLAVKNFPNNTTKEIAKCIGTKATLYTQLGCHACETQEQLFGENYQYLDVVDCFYNYETCINENITATPTWLINNQKIAGVQSIEKLQELTGC